MNNISNKINEFVIFYIIEEKTKIKKKFWIYSFYFLFFVLLINVNIFSNILGYLYLCYNSYILISTKQNNYINFKKIIVFWSIFSFFNVIEIINNLIYDWLPFYNQIKIFTYFWLINNKKINYDLEVISYKNNFIEKNDIVEKNNIIEKNNIVEKNDIIEKKIKIIEKNIISFNDEISDFNQVINEFNKEHNNILISENYNIKDNISENINEKYKNIKDIKL